jgi:hypothetical protein
VVRLTSADRRFISILAGGNAAFVETKLSERTGASAAVEGAPRARSLWRRIAGVIGLAVRIVRASKATPARGCAAVAFDRTAAVVPERLAYMAFFAPDESVRGLSGADALCREAGVAHSLWLLARLARLLVVRDPASGISADRLAVVRTCLLVEGHAKATLSRTAYLFRVYRTDTTLLGAYLMDRGVRVDLVMDPTPMSTHNRRLLADVVTFSNPYHLDEARVYASGSKIGCQRLWGPMDAPAMESAYAGRHIADLPSVIGVYTQGFWLRKAIGVFDEDSGGARLVIERTFLDVMARFAVEHPDVRLRVFPHPMERRHHAETGEHGFEKLGDLANVDLVFDGGATSGLTFDQVGLGVTTLSTVGFDRLYMGFRTLFFAGGDPDLDRTVASRFGPLFFDDEETFLAAVERERRRSHEEFMRTHFSGDAYPGWSAAPAGVAKRFTG